MRISVVVAMLGGAFACAAQPSPVHEVTVSITSDLAPLVVAFQDGLSRAWQPATAKTPTSFEATVHGPHIVTVVCEIAPGNVVVRQIARTLEDATPISVRCQITRPGYTVTGHMAQAGWVQMGSSLPMQSLRDNWDFGLQVGRGTYDLIATSDDAIAVRRGVVVDGDVTVPPIDVAAEGSALVPTRFEVASARPHEFFNVRVELLPGTTTCCPALIYYNAIDTAQVAPDSALLDTDSQTATVTGFDLRYPGAPATARTLRRPFRVGDSTVFALPQPFTGVEWTVDGGRLSVSWETAPLAWFQVNTHQGAYRTLDLSAGYLAAIGTKRLVLDDEIPGLLPAWKLDPEGGYQRQLIAQTATALGEVMTSSVTQTVNVTFRTAPPLPSPGTPDEARFAP